MAGRLVLVGTPIGNLEDISPRALRALADADRILAEDTRHSAKLLRHYGIATPLSAWHAHNENDPGRLDGVIKALHDGASLALISGAGMPLIADPGYSLVRAARAADCVVECVPGPTALSMALVLSGLPAERFIFEGFLPAKAVARRARLQGLRRESRTTVIYESPHRLAASLADVCAVLGGERRVCVARELTKRFESVQVGSAQDMAAWAADPGEQGRGEFVLVIEGVQDAEEASALDARQVLEALLDELPARKAAKLTARLCGGKANTYYQWALERD